MGDDILRALPSCPPPVDNPVAHVLRGDGGISGVSVVALGLSVFLHSGQSCSTHVAAEKSGRG